jgi:hypothetical protein
MEADEGKSIVTVHESEEADKFKSLLNKDNYRSPKYLSNCFRNNRLINFCISAQYQLGNILSHEIVPNCIYPSPSTLRSLYSSDKKYEILTLIQYTYIHYSLLFRHAKLKPQYSKNEHNTGCKIAWVVCCRLPTTAVWVQG